MIHFDSINRDIYIKERSDQPFKKRNAAYIEAFNKVIETAISDISCDGLIQYKNGDSKHKIETPFMFYNYGSPAPWLGKLLPEGYGFTHFQPNDIYKKCHIEHDIQNKLISLYDAGLFTRYKQPMLSTDCSIEDGFILVAMQNTGDTVWYRKNFTLLAEQIVAWSRENKRRVLFKWHNGCVDHSNPVGWFNGLNERSDYATIDHTTNISVLIKKCSMLWTASSMSGIEALIYNKPVAIFGETEYMEMATVANTPEEAITAVIPKDLDRWLTYYVRKYCINIYGNDAVDRVRTRVLNYFERGLPLDELILL